MIDAIDFVITAYRPAAGFALNTNLLETNLINLGVVLALLAYLGRGVLSNSLGNRERTILSTIRDAEARYKEATDRLDQARTRLRRAKIRADEIRVNGISRMQGEKQDLVRPADGDSKRLEYPKNATICSEEQKATEQVRRQVSRLALDRALKALNTRLNDELQLRMIDHNIGLLKDVARND
uniref:ATP synthase CF0 subunit I n=1 Tax=Selaginella lepidophylla TaxID=59777 RepID=A0A3T0IB27_SELLP|nr:ATP synthase CF0 subunit I [Selaginella lepidophylla]AZU95888.1 ATP synthase CF0 subunit I [Selaginella lepidophylla]